MADIFGDLQLDVLGPLPTSYENMCYLLTILDMTTQFIDAVPMPEATANNWAQALIDASISQFGLSAFQAPDLPCGIGPGTNTYDSKRSGGSRPRFAHQHNGPPTQIAGESLLRSSPSCPPRHLAHQNATGNAQGLDSPFRITERKEDSCLVVKVGLYNDGSLVTHYKCPALDYRGINRNALMWDIHITRP